MDNCVFCKIIERKLNADILYEDDDMIIINDITPRAKLHRLIIPKSHFKLIGDMKEDDNKKLLHCFEKFASIAPSLGYSDGYRLIINQGEAAHQTVFHLHIHALGGERLEDF